MSNLIGVGIALFLFCMALLILEGVRRFLDRPYKRKWTRNRERRIMDSMQMRDYK